MLDVSAQIGHDRVVKILSTTCIILGALALATSCKPQGVDAAKLSELKQRNADLRREIADMKSTIRRAGADVPDLAETIEKRYKEVAQALENLKSLNEQKTEITMRRIALEGRLETFRSTFRELQSQVAASSSSATPAP